MKNASDGYVLNSKRLPPTGKHHFVLKRTLRRGLHYGTDELVNFIYRSARSVAAKYRGSILLIGNMSKKGGGDLRGSASHNSGRDVDIPFYATNERGRYVARHGFVKFDKKGFSKKAKLRFDVRRNWEFVKACLSDKKVQVQWMFLSHPLRKMLLDYARRRKEPQWLITRAKAVLGQPGNSSAHAEHFHVRLYCARHERLEGCLNYGTYHPWIDKFTAAVQKRTAQLVRKFASKDPKQAIAALAKVGAIRGHSGVEDVAKAVGDSRPKVQQQALKTLTLLKGNRIAAPILAKAVDESTSAQWTEALVIALVGIGASESHSVFTKLLNRKYSSAIISAAINGLGNIVHLPAVPSLVALLNHPNDEVVERARVALHRITNHDLGVGRHGQRLWQTWWKSNENKSRLEWIEAGFQKHHGILTAGPRFKTAIYRLIPLIQKGGAISFNARTLIKARTDYWVKEAHFSDRQLYRFYRSKFGRGKKGKVKK